MAAVHFAEKRFNSIHFENSSFQTRKARVVPNPVLQVVQKKFLCWQRMCKPTAVRESVQHGTVAALRSNERSESWKKKILSSLLHFRCSVFESQSCDRRCRLRGLGVVLVETRRISSLLSQQWTRDMH